MSADDQDVQKINDVIKDVQENSVTIEPAAPKIVEELREDENIDPVLKNVVKKIARKFKTITCKCGETIKQNSQSKHNKSKKHLDFLNPENTSEYLKTKVKELKNELASRPEKIAEKVPEAAPQVEKEAPQVAELPPLKVKSYIFGEYTPQPVLPKSKKQNDIPKFNIF